MPEEKRVTKIPAPDGTEIDGEDLSFESLKESWSEYKLSDGSVLRLRAVAQKISRGMTPDGAIYYKDDGEPLYNVRFSIAIASEVPKSLLKE